MREYIVQPGDTLAVIARRELGSPGKWRRIAEANGLTNPDVLRVGQRLLIPSPAAVTVPTVLDPAIPATEGATEEVTFSQEGGTVVALLPGGDRLVLGRRFRKGISRVGQHEPEAFVGSDALTDLALSRSEINVMVGTAENEGNLDAINTWDAAFHSFGMFQWTAGTGDTAGELPALLARIKADHPQTFENYWGQFGLDVLDLRGSTGRFSLDGSTVETAADKEALRDYAWVLRFARAGADVNVHAAEILHAISRIDRFYFRRQERLGGRPLSEIITSEYGVALLLDNHVNRPGYVVRCVEQALANRGLAPAAAATADDATESGLLQEYLTVRETFGRTPMTNAAGRARVTRAHVDAGRLSEARESFQSNRAARA